MGRVLVVYLIILLLDLLVGCSLIVWKCSGSGSDGQCRIAVGSTIASVAVWLLVILVCPCFLSRCEICIALDNLICKCAHYLENIRALKQICIPNEIYLPTTTALLENIQDDYVPNTTDIPVWFQNGRDDTLSKGENITCVIEQIGSLSGGEDVDEDRVHLLQTEQGGSLSDGQNATLHLRKEQNCLLSSGEDMVHLLEIEQTGLL